MPITDIRFREFGNGATWVDFTSKEDAEWQLDEVLEMKKPKPVKSRIVWMPVYPDGEFVAHIYASTRKGVERILTDDDETWQELAARGWRIIRAKISPARV